MGIRIAGLEPVQHRIEDILYVIPEPSEIVVHRTRPIEGVSVGPSGEVVGAGPARKPQPSFRHWIGLGDTEATQYRAYLRFVGATTRRSLAFRLTLILYDGFQHVSQSALDLSEAMGHQVRGGE